MITKGKNNLKIYKGKYKPLNIHKNGQQIGGYSQSQVAGNNLEILNTYDTKADDLSVYGCFDRQKSKNICHRPFAKEINYEDGHYFKITPTNDGKLNFVGSKCVDDYIIEIPLPKGTYTISCNCYSEDLNGVKFGFEVLNYIELGLSSGSVPQTVILSNQSTIKIAFTLTPHNNEITELSLENLYIQIEEGTVATEFEPSLGNIYEMPHSKNYHPLSTAKGNVVCQSKNILRNILPPSNDLVYGPDGLPVENTIIWQTASDGSISVDGIAEMSEYGEYILYNILNELFEDNQTYTISLNSVNGSAAEISMLSFEKESGEFANIYYDNSTFVAQKDKFNYGPIRITVPENTEIHDTFYPQIEKGEKATPFVKGEKKVYPFPELRAIEVTKEDNYNYIITDQSGNPHYYIGDSVLGKVLTQRIGVKVFDGSEKFVVPTGSVTNHTPFRYLDLKDTAIYPLACSHFKFIRDYYSNTRQECISIYPNTPNGQMFFVVSNKNIDLNDVEGFSRWVKEQYDLGTPLTVYYVLPEPIVYYTNTSTLKTFPLYTQIKSVPETGYTKHTIAGTVKTNKGVN